MNPNSVWLIVFSGSLLLLSIILVRTKQSWRLLANMGMQLSFAALLIYCLSWIEGFTHFHIAINPVTVLTVGVLGVPGLLLLIGVKVVIV